MAEKLYYWLSTSIFKRKAGDAEDAEDAKDHDIIKVRTVVNVIFKKWKKI